MSRRELRPDKHGSVPLFIISTSVSMTQDIMLLIFNIGLSLELPDPQKAGLQ